MLPDVLEYCIEAPVNIALEIKNFHILPSWEKAPYYAVRIMVEKEIFTSWSIALFWFSAVLDKARKNKAPSKMTNLILSSILGRHWGAPGLSQYLVSQQVLTGISYWRKFYILSINNLQSAYKFMTYLILCNNDTLVFQSSLEIFQRPKNLISWKVDLACLHIFVLIKSETQYFNFPFPKISRNNPESCNYIYLLLSTTTEDDHSSNQRVEGGVVSPQCTRHWLLHCNK